MNKAFDLAGRVAIVTGGNGGIGLGMAAGLAQAGAALLIAGRNAAKNTAAVTALEVLGAKAAAVEADVTVQTACGPGRGRTESIRRLDILVNNAGTNIRKQPQEYTLEEWKSVLDTNLTSASLQPGRLPGDAESGGRKVINIVPCCRFSGPRCRTLWREQGGVVQLTRSLASAWAKDISR